MQQPQQHEIEQRNFGRGLKLYLLASGLILLFPVGYIIMQALAPYERWIGYVALTILGLAAGSCCVLLWVFVCQSVHRLWLNARLVKHQGVVSFRNDDGSWEHLSAMHNAGHLLAQNSSAFIVPGAEPMQDESDFGDIPVSDQAIVQLRKGGATYENIMERLGATYHRVQKVCKRAEENGLL